MIDENKKKTAEEKKARNEQKKLEKQQRMEKSLKKKEEATKENQENKPKDDKKEEIVNKKDEAIKIKNVDIDQKAPIKKHKTIVKKKLYCLTSYDDLMKEKAINSQKNTKSDGRDTSSMFHTHVNTNVTSKQNITSQHINKYLIEANLTSLNELSYRFLLSLSQNRFGYQGKLSHQLLEAVIDIVNKTEITNTNFMINQIRDKINKLLNVVNRITTPIGGFDNACKYIKIVLNKAPLESTPLEFQRTLVNKFEEFIKTKIYFSKELIGTKRGISLIKENDCLLVYGKSDIFKSLFKKAVDNGIKFRIIYVDTRQEYLNIEFLTSIGVDVTYCFINGISGIINHVTKVFIKAKSMLFNGNLLGSVGTGLISMIATNFKKPVIAFCETYKFSDKVLMDSFEADNIMIEEVTVKSTAKKINYLFMHYDITPANYIQMVVCELGFIPPTSVPVVIREFGQEDIEFE